MRWIENTGSLLSSTLAVLVFFLVVAQTTRPILNAALSDSPIAANVHQKLTRHCVEEVGGEEVDVAPLELTSSQAEEPDSKPTHPDRVAEAALPCWLSPLFHRKLPPPSPEDG